MKLYFDDGSLTGPEYRYIRKEILGMSQTELAEELGLHPQAIYKREQGWKVKRENALALRMLWLIANYDIPDMF